MGVRPSGNELGDNGFGAIMDLNGMAAVITGGESGIGAASAIQIANAGAAVTITYLRDRTAAQAIVDAIKQAGGRALAVQTDVTEEAQVEALFTAAEEAFGDRKSTRLNSSH